MKIFVIIRLKAGVPMEAIKPTLIEEAANAWRLWKAGIIRENYSRLDVGGVILVFECADVIETKRYLDDFPMARAGFIEWEIIPVSPAPLAVESLLSPSVDVAEPFDRTIIK